jgi:methylmalonyl-CoA/ethylmalonyl-CoA epimerase
LIWPDAGALKRPGDSNATQVAGRLASEGPEQAADRSPRAPDNDRLTWFAHIGNDTYSQPEGLIVLPLLDRIDHVGIACRDLTKTIELYQETFGLRLVAVETHEEQGVREAMLAVGPGPSAAAMASGAGYAGGYVQLLEPMAPDTPVGKFLARRGEGIHHIGYGVTDITQAMSAISAAGVRLIDERPRHGSMGASIAFLHPADLGGVLTELVQFVTVPSSPK